MKLLVVLLVVYAAAAASPEDAQKQIYCGRRLVSALIEVCATAERRPGTDLQNLELHRQQSDLQGDNQKDYVGKSYGLKRHIRSLVDDCCMKKCLISDMLVYC